MTDKHDDPFERAFDLLVYAPIGAALSLKDLAPGAVDTFVARGRAEIDRGRQEARRRVTTLRSLGEVVVAFGVPVMRQRVQARVDDARARAEQLLGVGRETTTPSPLTTPAPTVPAAAAPRPAFGPEARVAPADGEGGPGSPANETLPIPGYDALSASQVVERLAGLDAAELDAVHAYEIAHRQRRTILGKIEQLAG